MKKYLIVLLIFFSGLHASQDLMLQDASVVVQLSDEQILYVQEFRNKAVEKIIHEGLVAYSASKVGLQTSEIFSLVVKSLEDEIVAGIVFQIDSGGYSGDKCLLHFVWVDPEYRGCGIGTAMMRELEKYVLSKDCFEISIDFKNQYEYEQLRIFFEKMGFEFETIIMDSNIVLYKKPCMRKLIKPIISVDNVVVQDRFVDGFSSVYSIDIQEKVALELKTKYLEMQSDVAKKKYSEYFAIFITLKTGEIIAGAVGAIKTEDGVDFCFVDKFWVNEVYRGQNLGTKIMDQIIDYAKNKSCEFIQLYTLDFLARGFYEKQGFSVVATFPKSANEHSYEYYLLRKRLE
jgi:GNAT superfamily N-acetyltransferase